MHVETDFNNQDNLLFVVPLSWLVSRSYLLEFEAEQ